MAENFFCYFLVTTSGVRYLLTARIKAITSKTSPATKPTIPIRAGQPCTEPLKVTDHAEMESPALNPALPFHFDQREPRPTMSKTAEMRKSFRERMDGYFALQGAVLPTLVIVPAAA